MQQRNALLALLARLEAVEANVDKRGQAPVVHNKAQVRQSAAAR